ncbi:HigA family addiction module antitoxin [Pseudomonas putida]|uniref:HigA family addiction module antidote protein n=1 Tax=Pseudomonas putida TaxID=303 RepID=A0A8I1EDG7_PSEPU|nr:HigA family addiction module antitoxin [Pseudomonas putida]MBI6883249.1 HigA family addiction module antidote protein [Pseudomonas putida]
MTIKSPGTIIQELLLHLALSQAGFAAAMGMSGASISRILSGKAAITPETALRLEVVLNEPADFWMSLQAAYDIAQLRADGIIDEENLTVLEERPGMVQAQLMLEKIFVEHCESGKKIPITDLYAVGEFCGVKHIFAVMRRVDPKRVLFDYPLTESDRGRNGLPRWENTFEICAHPFDAHILSREDEIPPSVLNAFKKGVKAGHLGRLDNLVYNKETGTFGLLVTKYLSRSDGVDLDGLGECLGFTIACYDIETDFRSKAHIMLTAFVDEPAHFNDVPAIEDVLGKIAFNWNTKYDRDIRSQIKRISK